MSTQIEIERKAFAADVALVGLLACVDQLVPLEFGVVQKLFATAWYRTNEHSLAVGCLVLTEGGLVGEFFVAVIDLADVLVSLKASEDHVEV